MDSLRETVTYELAEQLLKNAPFAKEVTDYNGDTFEYIVTPTTIKCLLIDFLESKMDKYEFKK